ncbi:MAG: hypothetical protein ABSG76_08045 [Xanthobacteraceae bacterium]|jgi:hypothetical protein
MNFMAFLLWCQFGCSADIRPLPAVARHDSRALLRALKTSIGQAPSMRFQA